MDNLIFNITKIVDRKTYSDYLIQVDHPSLGVVMKVVPANGPEWLVIDHLSNRMETEVSIKNIIEGLFDEKDRFPSNNTYWGWSKNVSAWFTQDDYMAIKQIGQL